MGLWEVVLGLRGAVSCLARYVWGVIVGCVSGGQLGFVGYRVEFGDRWVGFGHGEFGFVVVGGCLGFRRAWAHRFWGWAG